MEKFNDSHSTYDSSYVNNNNNITKSLNEPDIDNRRSGGADDDEEQKMSKNRCPSREISKIWSPLRNSSSPSTSSELDVASPDIDVTKCNTPSPITVQATINPPPPLLPPVQTIAKNSEAFSVSALLKPDAPRTRHPYNHHHHHHQPAMASETISVTRSLLYPVVQFPDLIKDTRKEVHLLPSTANSLLHKHFSSFSFHPHFYSAANILNPSGSPEHSGGSGGGGSGGDSNIDNNHNLLTSSLYLSLGAVQAAAAAAFVHPLSTTGNLFDRTSIIASKKMVLHSFSIFLIPIFWLRNTKRI